MKLSIRYIIFFLLISNTLIGQSQLETQELQADTTKQNIVRIDHSDRIVIVQEDGKSIKYIAGNIELRQDSIYMYCDSAVIVDDREVYAYDSITIQQGDSLSVFSDTLYYLADLREAYLKGDVVLANQEQQLWTEEMTYDLNTKIARYENGATLYDDSLQVNSIKGYFDTRADQAKFIDSVYVMHTDFTLAADSLLYQVKEKKTIFIGPTRILQGDKDIYCESGYYDIANSISEFARSAQYVDSTKTATADTIRYFQKRSEIEMIGQVDYKEGDRIIRSDYLKYHEETGESLIQGNAYYEDENRTVFAEEILYNTKTDDLRTTGKSQVNEGDQFLSAEQITYQEGEKKGIAVGNVVWKDTASGYVIISDTAIYRKDIEYVEAFGKKKVLLKTVLDGDTLYLSSDELIVQTEVDTIQSDSVGIAIFDTVRIFDAFYNVEIFKSNLQAICDSLNYDTRDSMFHFYRNPIVWSDTSQFVADSIVLQLKNEKVDRFLLRENGFIVNESGKQFYNQIKGKYITAFFESDEVRRIFVEGNAESIYYAMDEDDAYLGVNESICSEMEFLFEEKQMNTVKFLTAPKSKMKPMNSTDHNSMRLDGFSWNIKDRPQSIEDLMK